MPHNFFYMIIYALIISGLYAVSYYLNHKTPVPKGCENLKVECEGCKINSCEMHPSHTIIKEEAHG